MRKEEHGKRVQTSSTLTYGNGLHFWDLSLASQVTTRVPPRAIPLVMRIFTVYIRSGQCRCNAELWLAVWGCWKPLNLMPKASRTSSVACSGHVFLLSIVDSTDTTSYPTFGVRLTRPSLMSCLNSDLDWLFPPLYCAWREGHLKLCSKAGRWALYVVFV